VRQVRTQQRQLPTLVRGGEGGNRVHDLVGRLHEPRIVEYVVIRTLLVYVVAAQSDETCLDPPAVLQTGGQGPLGRLDQLLVACERRGQHRELRHLSRVRGK